MQMVVSGVRLQCVAGDIAAQAGFDAVVNAANADLRDSGGGAGALHAAAGPELEEARQRLAPIRPGDAVLTAGFGLPNPYVVHCLGPIYGKDEPADRILAACYRNALAVADRHRVTSIAFPAISAGAFAYPIREAAHIAVTTVVRHAANLKNVRHVRFVLAEDKALWAFKEVLALLRPNG